MELTQDKLQMGHRTHLFAFRTWRSIALVSGDPTILPESASVLHTGLAGLWSRVSGSAQWSWVQLLGCFSCYPQCEPQPGPQQGGSRCHHNLTVCWPSHDRAISGPGLPTCCQFHWSQSSQIINNVPAPHLHLRFQTHSFNTSHIGIVLLYGLFRTMLWRQNC